MSSDHMLTASCGITVWEQGSFRHDHVLFVASATWHTWGTKEVATVSSCLVVPWHKQLYRHMAPPYRSQGVTTKLPGRKMIYRQFRRTHGGRERVQTGET